MLNWFKNKEVTVESILSTWTKAIDDLEAHAIQKAEEAFKHNALVTFYEEATDLAEAEVKKANDVIVKLKAIFA